MNKDISQIFRLHQKCFSSPSPSDQLHSIYLIIYSFIWLINYQHYKEIKLNQSDILTSMVPTYYLIQSD
ncbi:unnamed protein product [Schistosoma curassoni]|nr:unnamed protein product [Schistosoma curassoni]